MQKRASIREMNEDMQQCIPSTAYDAFIHSRCSTNAVDKEIIPRQKRM